MSIYLGKNRVDSPTRAQNIESINGIIPDQMGNVELDAEDVNAIYGLSVRKSLSSAGWYRVMEFTPTSTYKSHDIVGSVGAIIRFYITRRYYWMGNETHEVSLSLVNTSIKWMGEESNSVILGIDKIRYTTNSTTNKAYVDVHYTLSQENQVGVNFNVYCPLDTDGINYQTQFTSKDFVAVADAPSGETILAEYDFVADTQGYKRIDLPSTIAAQTIVTVASIPVPKGRKAIEACIRLRSANSTGKMLIGLGATVCTVPDGDYQAVTLISPITTETTVYATCYVYNSSSITMQGSDNCILYRFI